MLSHLQKNFDYDQGNDAMVVEAENHLSQAVHNLQLAIEASRHEAHHNQAEALEAIRHELEARVELLRSIRQLKD